jgi:hypothetical protein
MSSLITAMAKVYKTKWEKEDTNMSDAYHDAMTESINALKFDVRAEYNWWIENGTPHDEAIEFAKAAEQSYYSVHEGDHRGRD